MLSCMMVWRHSRAHVEYVHLVRAVDARIQMAIGAILSWELEPLRHYLG